MFYLPYYSNSWSVMQQLVVCGTKRTLEIKLLERLLDGDMVSTNVVRYKRGDIC